jgi:hypothetical protein
VPDYFLNGGTTSNLVFSTTNLYVTSSSNVYITPATAQWTVVGTSTWPATGAAVTPTLTYRPAQPPAPGPSAQEREAARATARELLLSLLDERQRDEYERLRRFTVIGADGEEYRIYRDGKSGNICRLNAEKTLEVDQFCIHDYEGLPDEDTYIAQKLLLETDPQAFRRIANRTPMRRAA